MARTCAQNGTEKDSQEGLKIESSRQKETGKAKKWPWEKLLRETLKSWNWHGEGPREKQKRDIHGENGVDALSLMDRRNERRRRRNCHLKDSHWRHYNKEGKRVEGKENSKNEMVERDEESFIWQFNRQQNLRFLRSYLMLHAPMEDNWRQDQTCNLQLAGITLIRIAM